jgi:hypothetical protein
MLPAPIDFLNEDLKEELGMKAKKDEGEYDATFCSLKVPMDHKNKDSKTYVVNIKKYDTGTPEELLRWRLTLNEKMKNYGYSGNYKMVMSLVQKMLAGRGLEACLSERRAQGIKNKTRKAKEQT